MLHNRVVDLAPPAPSEGILRAVEVAAAHAEAVDRDGRFPCEAIDALRAEGLLGAMVPVELGGGGATLASIARYAQQLAGACASTAMIFAMHQIQVACILAHGLESDWFRTLARAIASDGLLLASITSEVGVGGDMRSSVCAVECDGDRFTVTKEATTVSYGSDADVFLLTARAHPGATAGDQVLIAFNRADCTMVATNEWDALGMRGTCSQGFHVNAGGGVDQIIAAPFADIAATTMTPVSHLLWSAVWTGVAIDAVGRARAFLRQQARRQSAASPPGAPRLVKATGLLESMQQRLRVLLERYDASHPLGSRRMVMPPEQSGWPTGVAVATTLNMLKQDVSEMAHEAVLQALLMCGMGGYRNDTAFSVGRHLRDILSAQLMISNDRIGQITGALLIAQRSDCGRL